MEKKRATQLAILANEVRKNALTGIYNAAAGHPGGSLSIADLVTYLYCEGMNVSADDPKNPDRDRLVLSKGHA